MTLGSKFNILSMKDLFFKKFLILFHSAFVSPNSRTKTFITSMTAWGGLGRDANSLRFLELIPWTDFFAYSIKGCTYESSSWTDYFLVIIFCYSVCNARDNYWASAFLSPEATIAFWISAIVLEAYAFLTYSNFCFSNAYFDNTSTNYLASWSFYRPFCKCIPWIFFD